jgi:hypothetical protein
MNRLDLRGPFIFHNFRSREGRRSGRKFIDPPTGSHKSYTRNHLPVKPPKQFFVTYNKEKGKKFRVLRMRGPKQALKLVKKKFTVREIFPA